MKSRLIIVFAAVLGACLVRAQTPTVQSLKVPGHPRLLLTSARIEELRVQRERDPDLKLLVENLLAHCEELLPLPVVERKLERGNMLETSRAILGRMANLGMGWLLTGRADYKARALREAETAAALDTWLPDPNHFLDSAEMTLGFALLFDWLHADLSESERGLLRGAILKLGLAPAAAKYARGDGWVTGDNNWNQVCNAGFAAGAIALLREEPKTAEAILTAALKSAEHSKNAFAPDGVCVEGIGYWGYASEFGAVLYDSLNAAFGTDFGLSKGRGLDRAAAFMDTVLPNESSGFAQGFNFGDVGGISRAQAGENCAWYWFARRFGTADLLGNAAMHQAWKRGKYRAAHNNPVGMSRLHALSIVWFAPHQPRKTDRALDALFRGPVPIASLRSSWTDPGATHLFLKGGDNAASHGHLDLGGFELIADGVKWAHDLGMDSYALPGYFGKPEERAAIHRVSTRSHNTLVFGNANQKLDGTAPIVAFASTPAFAVAVVDLTKAYAEPKMRSLMRGFLFDRRRVLVQDEMDLDEAAERVRWGIVTMANATLRGGEATLSDSGKSLVMRLLAPAGARFSEVSLRPPTAAENSNEGARMIALELPRLPRGKHRIAVLLCPGDSAAQPEPALRPLADWIRSHPVKAAP